MIKAILFDFSRVLLNAKDSQYADSLNALHKKMLPTEKYHPLDHFEFNQPLLDFALRLKEKYDLYVYTTGTIQNDPHFKPCSIQSSKKFLLSKESTMQRKTNKPMQPLQVS